MKELFLFVINVTNNWNKFSHRFFTTINLTINGLKINTYTNKSITVTKLIN